MQYILSNSSHVTMVRQYIQRSILERYLHQQRLTTLFPQVRKSRLMIFSRRLIKNFSLFAWETRSNGFNSSLLELGQDLSNGPILSKSLLTPLYSFYSLA